jgi:hypothetical protein
MARFLLPIILQHNISPFKKDKFGGTDETRTRTFLIDNQAHSLCASIPERIKNQDLKFKKILILNLGGLTRFEPASFAVTGRRFLRLSYTPHKN